MQKWEYGSMTRRMLVTNSMLLRGVLVLAGTAAGLAAIAARAEPLPKEACDVLASEHDKLVAGGVKVWMAQGVPDARNRLGADKVGQIARFLEVDEQLLFRCGLYKARFTLPTDVEEPPVEPAAPPVKPPPAGREKAAPTPKNKPEPDRKKANQAASAQEPVEAAPAAKPAAKKKAKSDDAFRPTAPAGVD